MEKKNLIKKSYIPEIDGLRALAVLFVLFFHLKIPGFEGGFIGVDIFFVISGYLITSIYFEEIKVSNKFNFINYFKKRIFRLFPALIFTIFFTLILGLVFLSPIDLLDISKSTIFASTFSSNIYYFLNSSYWENLNEYKFFIHTWSLGVEMTFYVVMPFFLYLLSRFKDNFKVFIISFFIILNLVLILFFISKGPTLETSLLNKTFYGKNVSDLIFYMLPFRFYEFLFGSVIFFIPKTRSNEFSKKFFFILGLFLILFSLIIITPNHKYQSLIVCAALFGSSLLIYFKDAKKVNNIVNNKVAIRIGLLSYSLYLIHWPIISFFKYIYVEELSVELKIFAAILAVIISDYIFRYIEKPFRSKNYNKKWIFLFTIFIITALFSNYLISKKGLPERLDYDQKILYENLGSLNDPCKKIHSTIYNLEHKICLHGNEENAEIIILGDSNATTWFPSFKIYAEDNNLSVVNYRRICNSFPGKSIKNCDEITSKAKTLVIGSLWFNWQSNEEFIEKETEVHIKNISEIAENKNFKNIDKILLFGQIPAFKNNKSSILSCFLKPKILFKEVNCEKTFSYLGGFDNQLENYKKVNYFLEKFGKEMLSQNFKFEFIDPIKSLCNKKNECLQIKDNKIFYINNSHLSEAGSNYVFEKNKEKIFKFLKK